MTELEIAVDVINTTAGRHPAILLVGIAICQRCQNEFPAQTKTITRAKDNNYPLICPGCAPYYHREKRRTKIQWDDKSR